MTLRKPRVAILLPADATKGLSTSLEQSRLGYIADAFRAAGCDAVGAPFADPHVEEVHDHLRDVDAVLVWYNPVEGERDRTILNAMLRDVAASGVFVSTHPDIIDQMGTKEILHRTRDMGWGADTRLYATAKAMLVELPQRLASGPRVLKQIRGQSGDGIWKVELANAPGKITASNASASADTVLRVRHAKRGSPEETTTLAAFVALCQPYVASGGGMIDQPYQSRLPEGMIRCYVVGTQVEGFGEQLVNMLVPAPPGAPASGAPLPGPRLYFPPTRADFQRLKQKLEREWIGEMCRTLGLKTHQLPVLWDADFLYGPKDAAGNDTYVLCEINVSSVYPFPPDALQPLVANTMARIKARALQ
ncbi:MAG: Cj0069 family protein [Hyphomicrobiaceae bacterium]